MTDNSGWLTRLLIRQKSRYVFLPSLWRFLTCNKPLTNMASLLWFIVLVLMMLESLSTLGIIDPCLSPIMIFNQIYSNALSVFHKIVEGAI